MQIVKNTANNVDIISKFILISLIPLTLLELLFFPEQENLYGCITFVIAWGVLKKYVLIQENITKCFLPFITLLGLGICFFYLPLLMTLLEGKPLTFRFQCPYDTFNFQLINLVMLIAAYRLCLKVYTSQNPITKVWEKLGFFYIPTDKQLWSLGIIGIISQLFLLSIMGTEDAAAENLGIIGQLLNVTKVFACFPVVILFKKLYGASVSKEKRLRQYVFIYLVIISALALATGKRTAIFSSFVTLAMCYIVPVFTENKKIFTSRTFLLLFVAVYLITGPIADLAAAMALGRDDSDQTSSSKTFDRIVELYQDKETLHTMYQAFLMVTDNGGDNLSGWSEYYVDNIMLDRFCNLRVCDMTIDYANKLGFDNPTMHEYMKNQVLFLLPTPVLNTLGVRLNKFDLNYSPGDLLSMESLNIGQYHGYRVAGDVGIGLFLWGRMYFVFAFFIYFAFFYYLSSITKLLSLGNLLIPVPVLIDLFRYFLQFNNSTGLVGIVSIILRTGWQAVVLYCIILFVIKRIIK